jgi:hypothetical protein
MNIQNEGLLNSSPGDPNGYVTKDGMWAAVPWGKKFVILHNGYQVHTASNYKTAVSHIKKQIKANKNGPLDKFL